MAGWEISLEIIRCDCLGRKNLSDRIVMTGPRYSIAIFKAQWCAVSPANGYEAQILASGYHPKTPGVTLLE